MSDKPPKKLQAHVFVCTNERPAEDPRGCCKGKGSEELLAKLKEAVKTKKLNTQVRVQKAGCLDTCEEGPSVVVYPEGVWYGRVQVSDVEEIVQSHLLDGKPVERLKMPGK